MLMRDDAVLWRAALRSSRMVALTRKRGERSGTGRFNWICTNMLEWGEYAGRPILSHQALFDLMSKSIPCNIIHLTFFIFPFRRYLRESPWVRESCAA